MPTLSRSFSTTSNLSIISDAAEHVVDNALEPLQEGHDLSPRSQKAFQCKLRLMLHQAKQRVQHNYEAGLSGRQMISPHIWHDLDEIENLKRIGEEAKAADDCTKMPMPCYNITNPESETLVAKNSCTSRISIAMISRDVLNDPRLPDHTTGDDIARTTKINALRQAKLLEHIQPYDYSLKPVKAGHDFMFDKLVFVPDQINQDLESDHDDSVRGTEFDVLSVEDDSDFVCGYRESRTSDDVDAGCDAPLVEGGTWRLKITLDTNPEPTFQQIRHIKTPLGHLEQQLLPAEIAARLSSLKQLSTMSTCAVSSESRNVGGKEFNDRCEESMPYPKFLEIDDIVPDDGVPSYNNPFSSLFGKCKPVPMFDKIADGETPRHLRERFLMHERLRASLIRALPVFRNEGGSASDAARHIMSTIMVLSEDAGTCPDADELVEANNDERRKYAFAILQGFIDRCDLEGW